jgi:hypothetical protein
MAVESEEGVIERRAPRGDVLNGQVRSGDCFARFDQVVSAK